MTFTLGMLGMRHTHAHGLVRQIAAHPSEFRLVGAYDPDGETAADRAQTWRQLLPELQLFASPQELLNEPLDGVLVEGHLHENVSWAKSAIERDRPVLLEKPAGTDWSSYVELVDLAQARSRHLQMAYLFRYMSAVLEMLRLGREGELGEIYEFRARMPKDAALYDTYVEEYGPYTGGIFFEMAGHLIDMMVAMLGSPHQVSSFLAHHHPAPGDFIDDGLAVFEYPRARGIVEVTALEPIDAARRIEVYGTRGACAIPHLGSGHLANATTQPLDVCLAGESTWQRLELPAATLQIADLREFAACVRSGKQPDYSLEHDMTVQEMLLRACGVEVDR